MPKLLDHWLEADGTWTMLVEQDDGAQYKLLGCKMLAPKFEGEGPPFEGEEPAQLQLATTHVAIRRAGPNSTGGTVEIADGEIVWSERDDDAQ